MNPAVVFEYSGESRDVGTVTKLHKGSDNEERFVRITNADHRGFIEFQFSIGDPELYLEMTLPPAAFEEFCRAHDARVLSKAEALAVDRSGRRWRYGDEAEE